MSLTMLLTLRFRRSPAAAAATPTDAVTMPAMRRPDPPWVGGASGGAAIDAVGSGGEEGSGGAAGVGGGGTNGAGDEAWALLDWSGSRSLQSAICFSAAA